MSGLVEYAVLWPVLVPITAAALCTLCWHAPRTQAAVQLAALVLMLLAALGLLTQVRSQGVVAMTFGGWAPPFGISFVADHFGAAMVLVTAVLALAAGVFGLGSTHLRHVRNGVYPLLLAMLAAVNGAFLTGDIFNLYVWFEIMLISALGLLVLDQSRAQLDAALKYAVLNLLSTLLFLLAIALLYGVTGTLNMADLAQVLPQTEASAALTVSGALLLVGFAIKAGCFPMFFWLPASYHTIPIAVLALFAGLLTKVGIFACYRVFTLLFEQTAVRDVMAWMAAGTMLFGVFGAAVQWDVRRILSFHIISQIGYILLGLALGSAAGLAGGIFYILHHIIVKANLFLIAGAMYRVSGSYDVRRMGGLARTQPLLALLFAVPALSLAGIPPLSGFWAKFMVIDASLRVGAGWLAAVALFVGLLTIFSMSKIWIEAFWKPAPVMRSHRRTLPATMLWPIAVLASITLWIGLQPQPLLQFSNEAAQGLLDPQPYIQATFGKGASVAGEAAP
ncbi:Na+/H+ antiporter subunit D [Corticibacter populi]|uniref:Na+/H+ antiporter subunit D n=1 Tax=Corticibacter populi TaxID=1550736 RepID=A0A3M6QZ40_9BURK|nr:Na+/H+ antiporter subunit D [Corticibacter populi]RMX08201.1 Na+/H+ antiporter subunit D [Corticibacter populi]RZS35466.1 multisubunit sodium/proton antiporter MrpD subunit [Corticibacter populi]